MDKNAPFELHIVADCRTNQKNELLRMLAVVASEMQAPQRARLAAGYIGEKLLERETESTTEVDQGIFFPHARFKELDELTVILALPRHPAKADEPGVRFVCLLLIPEAHPMPALKVMSQAANLLRSGETHHMFIRMIEQGDQEQLLALLNPEDKKILSARDLMTPWSCELSPEMPLREATKRMLSQHAEVAPVLKNGRLVGEIACSELFKLGIPDFFSQLKSVGFIRYFDPFENYFAVEARSNVADVMTGAVRRFDEDATLIGIVFAMTVEKIPLLYVTDKNHRLLGVIDESVLLARIINL